MKIGAKQSRRTKFYQCGLPVNTETKKHLRNRSIKLSNAQRHVLRQMGVRVDKGTSEKDAVKLVKRIVTFESAYADKKYLSKWTRKMKKPKPKRVSHRQFRINALVHTAGNGSKRAAKELEKI